MKNAILLFVMLVPSLAFAGDHPCKDDAARLCAGIPHGGGRIAQCLKAHEAELSDACKARQAQHKERARAVKQACHDDLTRLCGEVQPGQGRKLICLRDHQTELSPTCAAALQPSP